MGGALKAVEQKNRTESIDDAAVVVPAQAHVVCSCSQTMPLTTGGAADVRQTNRNEPVDDAAVIGTAQAHVACAYHKTAPQTPVQPVKTIPSSHLASTAMSPPPPSCELPARRPNSPAEVTLRPEPKPGPKIEETDAALAIAAKNAAINGPPPSFEVPDRQPHSPVEVTLRQGPKPGPTTEEADAAAKTSAINSSYQKQIADLHEALQVSQKKLNIAEKDLAVAKQAVARALSTKRQKGGEQRAAILRLEDTLQEERNEFRILRQRSIGVSRALGEANETKAATIKAFAQFKEATQAKVVRLGREASRTKELERQLAKKELQLKKLKEEVARLRSDARAIEGLRETVESKVRTLMYTRCTSTH